jgi:hypothetical protein
MFEFILVFLSRSIFAPSPNFDLNEKVVIKSYINKIYIYMIYIYNQEYNLIYIINSIYVHIYITGFLSGSIFTPYPDSRSEQIPSESAGNNKQNQNWINTLIIIVTLLAILGLFVVCFIMYRREKSSRGESRLVRRFIYLFMYV